MRSLDHSAQSPKAHRSYELWAMSYELDPLFLLTAHGSQLTAQREEGGPKPSLFCNQLQPVESYLATVPCIPAWFWMPDSVPVNG